MRSFPKILAALATSLGFLALALISLAQMGKRVVIGANTPEDKALTDISAAADPAQKLALIDKFFADYGIGDMAIVAYELYIAHYQATKNPGKAAEYCEKLLTVDPENFSAAVNWVRAEQEKGDVGKLFTAGERAAAILTRYKAQPAPADTDPAMWEQTKAKNLADAQEMIHYVEGTLFGAGYQTREAATRAALLERYLAAFPDSPYTGSAQALVATAYQQAQNFPRMLAFAGKIVEKDPNSIGMLLLLADYYSDHGEQLDKAETYAKKALDLLPQAKRPEGVTEDQWQKQISLQKGLMWSALGQVHISRKRDAQSLEAFRNAAPLLKPDPYSYARNQYRMGFALINLKRLPEARTAFTEAASVDTPYRGPAQEKLKSLPAAPHRPAKKGF